MGQSRSSFQEFKERFQEFFWWTAPISLVADTIAIMKVFSAKQQSTSTLQPVSGEYTVAAPKVFGQLAISDAVFLTGLLTVFSVVSTLYFSYRTSRTRGNLWAIIMGIFASSVLMWLYLRLWLGEYWWAWVLATVLAFTSLVLCVLIGFPGIASYLIRSLQNVEPTTGPSTWGAVEKAKAGCAIAIIGIVIAGIFLLISIAQPSSALKQYNLPEILSAAQTTKPDCPGALPQLLEVRKWARVATKFDPVKVHQNPGYESPMLKERLKPGDVVMVTEGPACANQRWWWKVRTPTGQLGWVVESGDDIDPRFFLPTE